jgi:hypothetical protein
MPGSESIETVFMEDGSEHIQIPSVVIEYEFMRIAVSRWRLTDQERDAIARGADVVLQLLVGKHQLLTPSNLQVVMPDESPTLIEGF